VHQHFHIFGRVGVDTNFVDAFPDRSIVTVLRYVVDFENGHGLFLGVGEEHLGQQFIELDQLSANFLEELFRFHLFDEVQVSVFYAISQPSEFPAKFFLLRGVIEVCDVLEVVIDLVQGISY
jgi:hypothetical protein